MVAQQKELDCWRKLAVRAGEVDDSLTLDPPETVKTDATRPETEQEEERQQKERRCRESEERQRKELDHSYWRTPLTTVFETPEEPDLCTCCRCHSAREDVPFDAEEAGPTTADTCAGGSVDPDCKNGNHTKK